MNSAMRRLNIYATIGQYALQRFMAYRLLFWITWIGQVLTITLLAAFWQAVYTHRSTLAGLHQQQTISYIILAQILAPVSSWSLTMRLGSFIRDGSIATELVRPFDLQLRFYAESLASCLSSIIQMAIPIGILASIAFGVRLPVDPRVWIAFSVSFLLGITIAYLIDWLIGCLAFFTTEVWGLGVLRNGIVMFFGGTLIPLVMLPATLRAVAYTLPFAQAVYQPISLLAGLAPISQAPRIILVQIGWVVGLAIAARIAFLWSVRHVTVQGG